MKTFIETFGDHIDLTDGSVILTEQGFKQIQLDAQPEWQPIESAPRNEEVLVGKMVSNANKSDSFEFCRSTLLHEKGSWESPENYWYWTCDEDHHGITDDEGPTHWMPLPEPPQ